MDALDRKILTELQLDGRLTVTELAARVQLGLFEGRDGVGVLPAQGGEDERLEVQADGRRALAFEVAQATVAGAWGRSQRFTCRPVDHQGDSPGRTR